MIIDHATGHLIVVAIIGLFIIVTIVSSLTYFLGYTRGRNAVSNRAPQDSYYPHGYDKRPYLAPPAKVMPRPSERGSWPPPNG